MNRRKAIRNTLIGVGTTLALGGGALLLPDGEKEEKPKATPTPKPIPEPRKRPPIVENEFNILEEAICNSSIVPYPIDVPLTEKRSSLNAAQLESYNEVKELFSAYSDSKSAETYKKTGAELFQKLHAINEMDEPDRTAILGRFAYHLLHVGGEKEDSLRKFPTNAGNERGAKLEGFVLANMSKHCSHFKDIKFKTSAEEEAKSLKETMKDGMEYHDHRFNIETWGEGVARYDKDLKQAQSSGAHHKR
jgi:hypothetical protein